VTENKSRPVDANFKKFKNEHLSPATHKVNHRPFKHNIKVVSVAMQKVWDVLFCDVPHTIIHSSPVYQLVHTDFYSLVVY